MKRNVTIASLCLLVSFAFSACTPAAPDVQTSEKPSISTEIPADAPTGTPEFLNDIGKTLGELKSEHPGVEYMENSGGFPDCAAACFGEPEAEYVYYFFGGQDGDFGKVIDTYKDQLQCAGIITTASVLFPGMEDDMSFEEFFSWIGAEDYEYFKEPVAEGWLKFMYNDMEVWIDTNEITAGGRWDITGVEIVKRTAPVSIVSPEIDHTNFDLANAVMFD